MQIATYLEVPKPTPYDMPALRPHAEGEASILDLISGTVMSHHPFDEKVIGQTGLGEIETFPWVTENHFHLVILDRFSLATDPDRRAV